MDNLWCTNRSVHQSNVESSSPYDTYADQSWNSLLHTSWTQQPSPWSPSADTNNSNNTNIHSTQIEGMDMTTTATTTTTSPPPQQQHPLPHPHPTHRLSNYNPLTDHENLIIQHELPNSNVNLGSPMSPSSGLSNLNSFNRTPTNISGETIPRPLSRENLTVVR